MVEREIAILDRVIHDRLRDDPGYRAIPAIDGVGRVLAALFVAEIGDVRRFPNLQALCSSAGMTPRHRESDAKVRRGSITKQGSPLVRLAAIEAVAGGRHGGPKLKNDYRRIAARRGRAEAGEDGRHDAFPSVCREHGLSSVNPRLPTRKGVDNARAYALPMGGPRRGPAPA